VIDFIAELPLFLFPLPETTATLHAKKSDRNMGQISSKNVFLWIVF